MINWQELSPEQRNRLVAEKVMGWKSKNCNGEIGEKSISSDGWYCLKCGYSGYWGDDQEHEQVPLHYTTDMNVAMEVIHHFTVPIAIWKGHDFTCKFLGVFADEKPSYGISKNLAEAICKAALRSVGVDIE